MNLLDVIYNRLSYRCRRQRMISSFNQKVDKYKSMSEAEFTMEYIETKTRYARRRSMLTVISITILLLVVLDTRSSFCNILFQLFAQYNHNVKVVEITMLLVILTIIETSVLIIHLSLDLKKLTRHKIFLEEIKEMKYTTNKKRSVPVTGTN